MFLQEVTTHSLFNFHFGIGIPDNEIIPTLSFSDYTLLSNSPPSWAGVEAKLGEKYVKLAKDVKNVLASTFLHRLNTHKKNPTASKNILICVGRWESLQLREAFALGAAILQASSFGVFISVAGHPLTTIENAHELNPHLCGNSSFQEVETRYLFSTPIGLGDRGFDGTYEYGFARNQKNLFFLKLKKANKPFGFQPMFHRPIPTILFTTKPK